MNHGVFDANRPKQADQVIKAFMGEYPKSTFGEELHRTSAGWGKYSLSLFHSDPGGIHIDITADWRWMKRRRKGTGVWVFIRSTDRKNGGIINLHELYNRVGGPACLV